MFFINLPMNEVRSTAGNTKLHTTHNPTLSLVSLDQVWSITVTTTLTFCLVACLNNGRLLGLYVLE